MVTPLITQQIEDFSVDANSNDSTFELFTTFDDPSTTGQIVRFEFADNIDNGGVTDVLLFDQTGVGAPATVANFLNYVADEDYNNSIIHRSVPEFIVQGGGFTVTDAQVTELPADDAVVNEFNAARSNLRGTISMAKLGDDPDSATNQWFFNLADNSENLDNQNGGFTAFGQVLEAEDLEPIDAIAALPVSNGGGALSAIPVTDTTEPIDTEDLVYLETVSLVTEEELEFSITENTNEELVSATVNDGELVLDYTPDLSGEAIITVEATNLLGESVEDKFQVIVDEPEAETPETETPDGEMTDEETPETEADMPETETPDGEMTDEETPETEAETPETETPDGEMTDEETPETEAETPETETPDGEVTDEETPEPDTEIPEIETPEAETPEDAETPNADIDSDTSVFRFLNPSTGVHFYAYSEAERAEIESSQPDYVSEPLGYRTLDSLTGNPDAKEVFVLRNQDTGAFLYTSEQDEVDFIEANLPNYSMEEESLFAFDRQQPDTIPIYRFLNTDTGAHFYTASETERESIESNLPNYNSEGTDGVAFYAFEADV